jgi:selenoprotein W-related protein
LTGALLNALQDKIEYLKLIPGDSGAYEITVNGKLVYSKLETGRHADPGEILPLVKKEVR